MSTPQIVEKCDHNGFASQFAARIAQNHAETKPIESPRTRIVVPIQEQSVAHSPLSIVAAALASGNVEMYREAVALAKEMDAITARKAFDNAMADAKAKITVIKKNRKVGFDSRKAGAARTEYAYEDLAEIARTIDPILSEHGLSYRFRVGSEAGEPVRVTCIISHRDGHSEETTLRAGRDESGNKNAIQAIGSTVTYLQRYTLKAALGLAASHDDDGHASEAVELANEPAPATGCITQRQADQLRAALEAKGANLNGFLNWAKQKRLEDIPADHFESCLQAIANYRRN
jgi:ERF superfamily